MEMICFIADENKEFVYIGCAINVDKRLAKLQRGNPRKLILVSCVKETSVYMEYDIKHIFKEYKFRNSWYRYTKEIEDFVSGDKTKLKAYISARKEERKLVRMESDNKLAKEKAALKDLGLIYKITGIRSGMSYIGLTCKKFNTRKEEHIDAAINNKEMPLYYDMREFGIEDFKFEVLEDAIKIQILGEREKYYIKKFDSYKNGYNGTKGGEVRFADAIKRAKKKVYSVADMLNYDACVDRVAENLATWNQSFGFTTEKDINKINERLESAKKKLKRN